MKLSIVTTLYYSAPYIEEFYARIRQQLAAITDDYEFVFVNDGSPDNALDVALSLHQRDSRVRVVDLSRNFGHHKAMMTGLMYATGDLVFLIDVDLEEPPEALGVLYKTYRENDVDVVYGVQKHRKGPLLGRIFGSLFYVLFNLASTHPIPRDVLTARLMTRRYVQQLVKHQEQLFNIEGLWAITGFRQIPVAIDKLHYKGTSTYTFGKKVAYVTSAITAFSNKPLLYIAVLGLLMVIPAGLFIVLILFEYFVLGYRVDGYTSLIVSVWFLGGLIVFILGIIAIYLSVIFVEVKNRPYTVVRHVYERGASTSDESGDDDQVARIVQADDAILHGFENPD